MKNTATLTLISLISLISCKKETAKITKVNSIAEKTITVKGPTYSVSKVVEKPAIRDSAGIITQTFKLEKGKTYPFTTYQKDIKTITDSQGKSITATNESTDEINFIVNNIKDNIYEITINLVAKRNSQSAQGKTVVIDTKLPLPKEDELKMIWNINKALTGNKLQMKMDTKGNIISIIGFDPIYTKVDNTIAALIKDTNEKANVVKILKESFNEKVLKDQFYKNMMIIPKKGIKIGEKWSKTENSGPKGRVKVISNYVIKSLGNGTVEIGVTGGIPKKIEKKTQGPITHSLTSQLVQNGSIKFDENTGWVTNQKINVKTTQIETISDGKQSQSMKSISNSVLMVNPSLNN